MNSIFIRIVVFLAFLTGTVGFINAQGEDCGTALQLNNVSNYCSGSGFYTNNGSTASGFGVATCLNSTSSEDVWFSFTAAATDVLISAGGTGAGGTMWNPCISIYSGDCAITINEMGCSNGAGGVTQLYEGALIPGNTYYIRVSTTAANEGTFELCVNNFTPSANPGADCGGAAFLCNQNPISVATLSGGGANNDEPEASSCLENTLGADEGNSSWFYWTCGTAGSLTFDITPLNPNDDIDFIVYQLNTTNVCGSRTILRCNSSACLNTNGSTGLNLTDIDIIEDPNCDIGENAYCQSVNMAVGVSYALLVNNFSANLGFTVNFGGTATFQGPNPNIVVNPSTICAGQTVVFNGSTSTNVGGGLNWNFSNGGSPVSAVGPGPHSVAYNNTGVFTAILNGTDATGCQSTETTLITVTNAPNPPIVSNVTYCQGESATALTATGSNLNWYTSLTGGTGTSIAPTPSTSSIGSFSFFVSQSTNGCESSRAEIVVTITPPPTMNVPVNLAECANSSVAASIFTSTELGVSYSWTNTNNSIGIAASGNGNIPSFTGLNTLQVDNIGTITVIPSLGTCSGPSTSFTITIYPLPQVDAGLDVNVCEGESVTLSASGANNYVWDNSIQNLVSFIPTTSANYTVIGTSIMGCTQSDQLTVTVNPIPIVDAGDDLIVCEGQTVILLGNGANTYTWDNGVINGLAFNPNPAISTYTVVGTTAAGCESTDQLTIQVISVPVISFAPDVTSGCSPLTVNFTNTTANSVDCIWEMSDGTSINNCGNVVNTFDQAGCYDITLNVTFPNGCAGTFTEENLICVEPDPIASFIATPSILNEYDTQATFNNTSIGGSTYSWDFGDNSSSSDLVNPTHDYAGSGLGNYPVTLIAYSSAGCIDTFQSIVQIKEDLIFYIPNTFTPDGDIFNQTFQPVFTSGFDPYNFSLLIFNRWGQVIFESHDADIGWDGTYAAYLGIVQDGLYTWKIEFKMKDNDEKKVVVGHVNLIR